MKRTGLRLFGKRTALFFRLQWRMLLYLLLLLCGFTVGCLLFFEQPAVWTARLSPWLTDAGETPWLSVAANACLLRWLLLAILLAAAVSVYGLPVIVLLSVAYGGWLGLSQCFWYAGGAAGILTALLRGLLPATVQIPTLLAASSEATRMTAALAGQLLPGAAHTGLWPLWRGCMLRFLLCFGLSTLSALLETAVRVWT